MKQRNFFLACVIAATLVVAFMPSGLLSAQTLQPDSCHVTRPNGIVAGSSERNKESYGNALLSVGPFGLWPNGTVVFKPGGPGFQTQDGALGMKFYWTRGVRGKLKVTGRRIDADAPPLRFETARHEIGGVRSTKKQVHARGESERQDRRSPISRTVAS